MNHYEQKLEDRRERLQARADKNRQQANTLSQRAGDMASIIPFGQPVLLGHHSEGRDRRYRERIRGTMDKAIEADKKAEYYQEKAATVGTGGISADDPDALKKLEAKLEQELKDHELRKTVNAAIRKGKTPEAKLANLVALNLKPETAAKLLEPDSCGRVGFPDYELTNANARIRQIKQRIDVLKANATRQDKEIEYTNCTYREDTESNRVMIAFPSKPDQEIRQYLRAQGFKWCRTSSAWQRQLNNSGIYAAQCCLKKIEGKTEL